MIVYATGAGDTAEDGGGRNSPFTAAFLQHISTPGQDVYDLYRNISADVSESTGGRQRPEQYGNVTIRYALVRGPVAGFGLDRSRGSIRVSLPADGTVFLDGVDVGSLDSGQTATLTDVEEGEHEIVFRYGNGGEDTLRVVVRGGAVAVASFGSLVQRDSIGGDFPSVDTVYIAGGRFEMGRWESDEDEAPVHEVRLDPVIMMTTEVTFDMYDAYCRATGTDPTADRGWGREIRPVINVTWYDAVAFANWLSTRDGYTPAYTIRDDGVDWNVAANGWRLPTEAEWEYAARGGQQGEGGIYPGGSYPSGLAWFNENSDGRTHPVGSKGANELGLLDMSGNVSEWCWDWYHHDHYNIATRFNPGGPDFGTERVRRGGGWYDRREFLGVTNRAYATPGSGNGSTGFRLVRNAGS